jgi:hypothetical protein
MVAAGLVCTLEEIAITLLLPQWTVDVPSLFHAMRLRMKMQRVMLEETKGLGDFKSSTESEIP